MTIWKLATLFLALTVFATGCAAPTDLKSRSAGDRVTQAGPASPTPVVVAPQSQAEVKTAPPSATASPAAPIAPPKQEAAVAQQPKPAALKSTVTITGITTPIRRGANATVMVNTGPGANCSITVTYKSGPSTAGGLYSKQADGEGRASWTWMVGTRTTPGNWPVTIMCNGVTARTSISVQ